MDHPRIRGEHRSTTREKSLPSGSSPHTRGARAHGPVFDPRRRIIPAYAGSTGWADTGRFPRRDHPRIRGEHSAEANGTLRAYGSSPHTRGAQRLSKTGRSGPRIIPAYAGSTPASLWRSGGGRDHPRIRGEHGDQWGQDRVRVGSSPHTRGALPPSARRSSIKGIIPAYAGSTPFTASPPRTVRDHPRIRGEHLATRRPRTSIPGSSPHTRGARDEALRDGKNPGIIPAYAGSTSPARATTPSTPDHPRIRGEHFSSRGYGP